MNAVKVQYDNGEISSKLMYEKKDVLEYEWLRVMNEFSFLWKNSRAWVDFTYVAEITNNSGKEKTIRAFYFDDATEKAYISEPIQVSEGKKEYIITIPSYGYYIMSFFLGYIVSDQT